MAEDEEKDLWTKDEIKRMKRDMVTLMDSAGETISQYKDVSTLAIKDLLAEFEVGTEKRKEWKQRVKLPPKPSELGPVTDYFFMSTARRARLAVKRRSDEHFQQSDEVNGEVVPFTNIYDKGYRAKHAAWKHGKQRVMQPDFAKSDEQFSGSNTLYSACVATDRGGNERGVNVSKCAGFISRGFTQTWMCLG